MIGVRWGQVDGLADQPGGIPESQSTSRSLPAAPVFVECVTEGGDVEVVVILRPVDRPRSDERVLPERILLAGPGAERVGFADQYRIAVWQFRSPLDHSNERLDDVVDVHEGLSEVEIHAITRDRATSGCSSTTTSVFIFDVGYGHDSWIGSRSSISPPSSVGSCTSIVEENTNCSTSNGSNASSKRHVPQDGLPRRSGQRAHALQCPVDRLVGGEVGAHELDIGGRRRIALEVEHDDVVAVVQSLDELRSDQT